MDNQIVTIISSENDEVLVHRRAAMLNSEHLRTLLAFSPDEKLYLNIDTPALSAVVNFMEQNLREPLAINKGNYPPEAFLTFELVVPQVWYQVFCQTLSLNTTNFQRVQRAASHLGINHLTELLNIWSSFEQLQTNAPNEPGGVTSTMDERLPTLFPADGHSDLGFSFSRATGESIAGPVSSSALRRHDS